MADMRRLRELMLDASAETVGPAFDAADGVWRFTVRSQYQRGPNAIEVLLPDCFDASRTYPVLYVLPVETGLGGHYGNGLQEVRKAGLHNKHGLIAVAPAFDTEPWFGDNPADPTIRHESYVIRVVVPLVEGRYPTLGTAEGRLLVGFSKSGWGAFTLILRNPDFFGYAAAWDAPLMLEERWWRMVEQFGGDGNFQKYRPADLFEWQARHFRGKTRLVLLGECGFGGEPGGKYAGRSHTVEAHQKMEAMGIRHIYRNDVRVEHRWDSGWVPVAVDAMMALRKTVGG